MNPRRWLITGVSGGLGRAIAEAALARGDQVAGTLRRREQIGAFEALAPGRAYALPCELADLAGAAAVPAAAAECLGGLDVVVNNAGYALAGAVEEVSEYEARHLFEVNLFAPLVIMQAALPRLRESRGRIVNIASMAALQGFRGLGLYSASKAALALLSETLDIEAAPFGVRVISVEAAALRTSFAGSSLATASRELPHHAEMRAEIEAAFAASNGNQPNDPTKAAMAILALTDLPDPPRHFALGANAAARVDTLLESRREEYRRFAALGAATARD